MLAHALAAAALLALSADAALATDIRVVPVPERVARADAVVVGAVTEVEEKPAEVAAYAGGPKVRYRVAKVTVSDELAGPGALKEVRVAFVAAEDQPGDGLEVPTPVLDPGNEVLLFLRRSGDPGVYLMGPGAFGAAGKNTVHAYQPEKFGDAVTQAKAACKTLNDAANALKSKDDAERMAAAWMLVTRYRDYRPGEGGRRPDEVPLGGEESRAILEGLLLLADKNAEALHVVVLSLNLTKDDGYDPPFTAEKAKAWIAEHAATYRVKKLVPAAAK